jgi:hypothetical protein
MAEGCAAKTFTKHQTTEDEKRGKCSRQENKRGRNISEDLTVDGNEVLNCILKG